MIFSLFPQFFFVITSRYSFYSLLSEIIQNRICNGYIIGCGDFHIQKIWIVQETISSLHLFRVILIITTNILGHPKGKVVY